jgi:hypothetical protein
MIGWTPFVTHASVNGIAAYRPFRSVTAAAGKPRLAARAAMAFGSIAPSSMVKQEKTRRGT